MHVKWNLSSLLEFIALAVSYLCGKIDLDSDSNKISKIIAKILTGFSIIYLFLGCMSLCDYFVMRGLQFLQEKWIFLCLYIFLFALVPPAVASIERKKRKARIEISYIKWNRIYNLLGALTTCLMLALAHDIIGDFAYLRDFHIEGIISVLISACVWLVLAYQCLEGKKEITDHDASIKWLNQKLNMLHLFHAYFFSAIAVVSIVCYSIYCHIHNLQLTIRPNYFLFLMLALLFFYMLSQHQHQHVYLVFAFMVPVILISSVYWMSWFIMSFSMRFLQWIFIVSNTLLYAILILYRNKILYIGTREKMAGKKYPKIHKLTKNLVWSMEQGGFYVALLLIIIICYTVSWFAPMLVQRINGSSAENYITAICRDTDIDADEMIELARERSTYDTVSHDYDSEKYLKFLREELHDQILAKGIITADDSDLTCAVLQEWYSTIPMQ